MAIPSNHINQASTLNSQRRSSKKTLCGNHSWGGSEHSCGGLSSSTSTTANVYSMQTATWKGRRRKLVNLSLMRLKRRRTYLIANTINMPSQLHWHRCLVATSKSSLRMSRQFSRIFLRSNPSSARFTERIRSSYANSSFLTSSFRYFGHGIRTLTRTVYWATWSNWTRQTTKNYFFLTFETCLTRQITTFYPQNVSTEVLKWPVWSSNDFGEK